MRLLAPEWLWLLWALPALGVVLLWAERRAGRRVRAFAGELARRLVTGGGSHAAAGAVLLAGVGTAVVALARPAWGEWYEEVHSEGMELVVALDVSRSMLAEDAAPSRLERARIAIGTLLDRLEEEGGHRIGLLVFAGVPVVRAPVTTDYGFVREQLRRTSPADVPRGGTLIGDAVRRSLDLLERPGEQDRVVLLLTDGEDHESFPLEAAAAAADAGVAIFAVGIGDPSGGGRIPYTDEEGRRRFVEHDGEPVVSRLDEETLRRMAEATGGGYVPAGTRTIPLDAIYEEAIATRGTARLGSTRERRHRERFQWAVGLALMLVVLSRFLTPRSPEEAA
jgi:Ca-activated chloride channel family protein